MGIKNAETMKKQNKKNEQNVLRQLKQQQRGKNCIN